MSGKSDKNAKQKRARPKRPSEGAALSRFTSRILEGLTLLRGSVEPWTWRYLLSRSFPNRSKSFVAASCGPSHCAIIFAKAAAFTLAT